MPLSKREQLIALISNGISVYSIYLEEGKIPQNTTLFDFVSKAMNVAKKQNHHPDITVHYDNVKISITDHEKGKVSDKCRKYANAINKIK